MKARKGVTQAAEAATTTPRPPILQPTSGCPVMVGRKPSKIIIMENKLSAAQKEYMEFDFQFLLLETILLLNVLLYILV